MISKPRKRVQRLGVNPSRHMYGSRCAERAIEFVFDVDGRIAWNGGV